MIKLNRGADVGNRNQHIRVVNCPAVSVDSVKAVDLARMCYENKTEPLALSKKNFLNKTLLALVAGLSLSSYITDSDALGVGSATADSYIGEMLMVRVPLFNVEDPNSLSVTLTQADGSVSKLQAEISRVNSQLGIVVRSERRVNEPYLNFTLDLNDNNNVFSKEFTVLLNLSPQRANLNDSSSENLLSSNNISAQPLGNNSVLGASLMGPYDWAEAGQIPEKFGAVLDGQSLWRVARRINRGLGVSINQMMWSLYQQNPDAFSNQSINSLKAGSYLKIPSYQMASQLSDSEAKRRLDGTQTDSELTNSLVSSSEVEVSAEQAPDQPARGTEAESSEAAQQFQLTAIDEIVSGNGVAAGATDGKSQEIISSLAETVGNLTQELIRKDKQIAFLEEKVNALAEFAGVDADVVVESTEASLIAGELESPSSELSADISNDPIDALEDELTELDLAEAELIGSAELVETEVNDLEPAALESEEIEVVDVVETTTSRESSDSFFQKLAGWHWIALALAGLALFAALFRRRLSDAFGSLNLSNRDSGVEFKQSVFDSTDAPIGKAGEPSGEGKDFSVLSSVKHEVDEDEAIEGISYLSVDENGEYHEADSKEVSESDLEFVNDEDMTFSERFERLLKDKDFDFARELLDFARYNEIDEERYHCERLRLLQAMQDEDGFYEYYYEIESKIPSFAPNYQTQISQLVVELSQHEG